MFLKKHNPKIIVEKLSKYNIYADAPYSPLLHQQNILKAKYSCPKAESLTKTHISLPIHMKISLDDARYIATTLKNILSENNNE